MGKDPPAMVGVMGHYSVDFFDQGLLFCLFGTAVEGARDAAWK